MHWWHSSSEKFYFHSFHLEAASERAVFMASLSHWKSCPPPALGLVPQMSSFVLTGHALGVPSPREGACALRPAPIPHPALQEEEDNVRGCRACPARQPPTKRQPPLHAFPWQRQQPQQHWKLVSQAQHQASTGTALCMRPRLRAAVGAAAWSPSKRPLRSESFVAREG